MKTKAIGVFIVFFLSSILAVAQTVSYRSGTSGNTVSVQLVPGTQELRVYDKDMGVVTFHLQTINPNNGSMYFISKEKGMAALLSKDASIVTFGVLGSSQMENYYVVGQNGSLGSYSGNSSSGSYSGGGGSGSVQRVRTRCYACHGLGRCPVCKGSGRYSNYGYSSICSACKGSGKCYRCGGSGYEAQ
ncbi:MAG: hypothetical protein P4K83_06960 [Terracidiphilus sp.]|nr:hypothetical protein [Terracidiphilus sp.]